MTKQEANGVLRNVVSKLVDHFDSIQIVVSFPDETGTGFCEMGNGNMYARESLCRRFVNEFNEKNKITPSNENLP